MMKKQLLSFIFLTWLTSFVFGQTDTFYLHSKGEIVYKISEDDLDSITVFRAAHRLPSVRTNTPKKPTLSTILAGAKILDKGVPAYTEMGICWDTLPDPDLTKQSLCFGQISEDSIESLIQHLKTNKTYHVRAYAINPQGTVYGASESFTTQGSQKVGIYGQVTDLDGKAVGGVLVKVENTDLTEIYTDTNGLYYIPSVTLTTATSVTFSKDGFLESNRTNQMINSGMVSVDAKLIPKRSRISMDTVIYSGYPLIMTFAENKATVQLQAGSYIDESGNPYTGSVLVSAAYLDPTDSLFAELMPGGDLTAERTDNSFGYLYSMGMIGVEMRKPDGEKLQLNGTKKATITATIPDSLLADAEATIPMWHYDNKKGLWVESGVGTRVGNKYVAEVEHFSWCNYDFDCPFPVTVKGKVTDQNGNPVGGIGVEFRYITVQTDSAGEYIANFTEGCTFDEKYTGVALKVPGCPSSSMPENIPIQQGKVTIKNFVALLPSQITVKGTVRDINGNPVPDVAVRLKNGTFAITNVAGKYETSMFTCDTLPSVSVYIQVQNIYSETKNVVLPPNQSIITQDFVIPEICTISGTITACDVIQDSATVIIFATDNYNYYLESTEKGSYTKRFANNNSDITIYIKVIEPNTGKLLTYSQTISVSGCPSITHNVDMGCDTANNAVNVADCANHNLSLGTVSFATTAQYVVPAADSVPQTIWSDAVTATGCNKPIYEAVSLSVDSTVTYYMSDCRNNPGYPGDLFSECAVLRYGHILCPSPWRVPTKEDFINLDKALGGTGNNRGDDITTLSKYMDPSIWGGAYGGYVNYGSLISSGKEAFYWSSENTCLYLFYFQLGNAIHPQYSGFYKDNGFGYTLRCVRD